MEEAEQQDQRGSGLDECLRALKANAAALLERCDIVTRRDFEVQQRLLAQAMAKLEAVESRMGAAKPASRRRKAQPPPGGKKG